jgi:hypothetical protein
VALNSPITVPIAEFSAMPRLLAVISVGAEFAERWPEIKHNETTREKQEDTKPAFECGHKRDFINDLIHKFYE